MWLIIPVALGLILVVVGSFLFGGVFTIVTVPILIAALGLGFGWRALAQVLGERRAGAGSGPASTGVPSTSEASYDARRGSSTPSELADARRTAQ